MAMAILPNMTRISAPEWSQSRFRERAGSTLMGKPSARWWAMGIGSRGREAGQARTFIPDCGPRLTLATEGLDIHMAGGGRNCMKTAIFPPKTIHLSPTEHIWTGHQFYQTIVV